MGPPVIRRRWSAPTLKAAIADEALTRLADVPADAEDPTGARLEQLLRAAGWIQQVGEGGFTAGQPQYNFQLPLAGSEDDLLKGMNQLWRRNIKKATKEGVDVSVGGRADLAAFHAIYVETATRDGFTPALAATSRPCSTRSTPRTRTACASISPATTATWWRPPPWSASVRTPGTPTARPPRPSATYAAPTPSSGR
jgi:hypothetical protein